MTGGAGANSAHEPRRSSRFLASDAFNTAFRIPNLLRDLFDALKKIDTSALVAPKRAPRRPPAKS